MVHMESKRLDVRETHKVKAEWAVRMALKGLEVVVWVLAIVFVLIFVLVDFLEILFLFVFLVGLFEMLRVESRVRSC